MTNYEYILYGAIFGLVGKIVFDWLKSRKNGNNWNKILNDRVIEHGVRIGHLETAIAKINEKLDKILEKIK